MTTKQESVIYQYSPLPSRTAFRYLILQPGLDGEPLVGSLHIDSLDNSAVEYEAISYVWGSTTKEETILCEGAFLNISTNLHEALTRFRLPDTPRALWADSICINQDDLDEKSCQVALMGTIYGVANCVLVYLRGNDDGHAAAIRSLTQRVANIINTKIESLGTPVPWNSFPLTWPVDIQQLSTDSRWPSMSKLMTHPWFSRAWVVQEVTLAKQVLITWGPYELSWEHLMTTITWIMRRAGLLFDSLDLAMGHVQCFGQRHEATGRAFFPEETLSSPSFLHFLDLTRVLNVSNPQDKIYAFREIPYFEFKSREAVQPDYRVDALEAFRQFTVGHTQQCRSPEILDYITHDDDFSSRGTISWVPQWQPIREVGMPLVTGIAGGPWPRLLSRTMSIGTPKVIDAVILSVEAAVIDTVAYSSSVLEAQSEDSWREAVMEMVTQAWQALLSQNLPNPYDSKHMLDAFINALTLGLYVGTLDDWNDSVTAMSYALSESSPSTTEVASPWMSKVTKGNPELFLSFTRTRLQKRRVIFTHRGYIGLAPNQAQKGDLCGIIFGCKTPCVLRRTSHAGEYTYVGPTYVPSCYTNIGLDGMMRFPILGAEDSKDWTEWDDVEEGYIQLR
ncbi:heterokaryon incompatibility protein-domain-containing protein [Paraphoma chrysanthemicola]|uniref:Heterokaryon incompatibility protein-domain-containing protein n=1 Tax=Paraphoma chrysanthemicola TaxID=798071 RepID=A0A8K0W0X6_9PLEO|nr:heterokaryon incompatibility protein-domain-containing protein [Paraphoma chrysanthemicola]